MDYINKPISPAVVRARVKTHLALRAAQERLSQQNKALLEAEQLRLDVERITRHDMKTPIHGVTGFAHLLRDRPNLPAKERSRLLGYIIDAVDRLQDMVNQSLHLYHMERGTYELEAQPFDLLPLIPRIMGNLHGMFKNRKITTHILYHGRPVGNDDLFLVDGEEALCYSLFSNLIKNAMEASPAGETVTVALEKSAIIAVVTVHNIGAVPEAVYDRFFEKYVTSGKKGGTGLGTYSARLMVEAQRGGIQVDSSKTGGTTVTVRLPVKGEDLE